MTVETLPQLTTPTAVEITAEVDETLAAVKANQAGIGPLGWAVNERGALVGGNGEAYDRVLGVAAALSETPSWDELVDLHEATCSLVEISSRENAELAAGLRVRVETFISLHDIVWGKGRIDWGNAHEGEVPVMYGTQAMGFIRQMKDKDWVGHAGLYGAIRHADPLIAARRIIEIRLKLR